MLNLPAIQTPLNPRVFLKPPPPPMAATTKITRFRPKSLPITTTTKIHNPASLQYFSSSSNPSSAIPDRNGDPDPESNSQSQAQSQSSTSRSSFLDSIKASLRQPQHQSHPQSQPPPSKSFFSGLSNASQRKSSSTEEIKRNLAAFRMRTTPPPPPPPGRQISFEELYKGNKGEESTAGEPVSFTAIRNSLRNMLPTPPVNGLDNTSSRPSMSPSLKFGLGQTPEFSPLGSNSSSIPSSIFEPELRAKENNDSSDGPTRTDLLKMYDHKELGEKLKLLRPDKKGDKKDWFSLEELNNRLARLREMELKESESRQYSGININDFLKESLAKAEEDRREKDRQKMQDRFNFSSLIGETSKYSTGPPKEELIEKYFHPDNMSASEKLKLELHKVRDEFKMSEMDCGSARVQVAQLTTKIKHLSGVLHKKDKHSRKGLQAMVEKRKKLLKYMRRTDWESYCFVLTKLGLRDNPGYKH